MEQATSEVIMKDVTDMDKCDKCQKCWPGQKLARCNTCFTKTCLRCQCESVGGLHNHIRDCFTFPNNPGIALAPLTNPSLASVSPRLGLLQPIAKPFTALEDQTWIHDRPEEDMFRLLVDSYRLRLHDSFLFEGETKIGTIYSGCIDSKADFHGYLNTARRRGLLSESWELETHRRCVAFGMADFHFHSLKKQLTQAMVVDYYKDATFPTQLRLFAEDVQGRGVTCLRTCRGALDALVNMEEFERTGTTSFDWNAYNTAYVNQDWERGQFWGL